MPCVSVHITEVILHSRERKKVFSFQNHEVIISGGGVKSSKIRSVEPEGVQYNRLITNRGFTVSKLS